MNKHLKYAVGCAAVLMLGACAFDGKLQRPEAEADPYEAVNRKIFSFNEGFYENVMFPIARGYRKVTTPFIRERVRGVVSNLQEPVSAANHLLQLEFVDSLQNLGRFALNSTLGLGGMFDVAQGWKLEPKKTGFNETMASWCVAEGPYLVVPFLGASSPRGVAGTLVDAAADPVYWVTYQDANIRDKIRYSYSAVKYTAVAEAYMDIYDDLKRNSVDFYSTMRSAYQQNQSKYKCRFAPADDSQSYDFDFGVEDEDMTDSE
ncbi:MAG: VacJ family lipoprotein [Alphaproteobacteria bacterium]|nr:VacJ family lipoprotein [Alphaproteobacteria bacterium]